MSTQWEPRDKTFLITGGASGLGALYAEKFLKEGAKRIAILDIAVDKGQELAAKLNVSYSDKVTFYKCDVSDEKQLTDVFDQVVTEFGQVDVIINNAGIMVDTPKMWRQACNVNWQGLVSLTLKGIKHMRKDEGGAGGTIINVSSTFSMSRTPFLPIYAGSKAAVLQFSQSIAMGNLYDNTGVRILVFCLDATQTDLLEDFSNKTWHKKVGELISGDALSVIKIQKPESAVNAFVKMCKDGTSGSIWLSTQDKPAEDITQIIDSAFKTFEQLIEQNEFLSIQTKNIKYP